MGQQEKFELITDPDLKCSDCSSVGFMTLELDIDNSLPLEERLYWACGSCGGGYEADDNDINHWKKVNLIHLI